jgi:hypothetical protein
MKIHKPTITDFTNAVHSHTNDAGGGLISVGNPCIVWSVPGTLAASGTSPCSKFYVPFNCTITAAYAVVTTAPTGAGITIDIHYDGTTIWSTQANRLAIAATATIGTTTTFNTTALVAGKLLEMFIDVVGSTIPGAFLTVELKVSIP